MEGNEWIMEGIQRLPRASFEHLRDLSPQPDPEVWQLIPAILFWTVALPWTRGERNRPQLCEVPSTTEPLDELDIWFTEYCCCGLLRWYCPGEHLCECPEVLEYFRQFEGGAVPVWHSTAHSVRTYSNFQEQPSAAHHDSASSSGWSPLYYSQSPPSSICSSYGSYAPMQGHCPPPNLGSSSSNTRWLLSGCSYHDALLCRNRATSGSSCSSLGSYASMRSRSPSPIQGGLPCNMRRPLYSHQETLRAHLEPSFSQSLFSHTFPPRDQREPSWQGSNQACSSSGPPTAHSEAPPSSEE